MASFKSSSSITITGGNFTHYEGDCITHVYGNLVQCSHSEKEKETTDSEQYRLIPTGKVRLQRTIADSLVERDDVLEWGSMKARRCVSMARVDGEESEFLHVGYSGPDAVKAYQKDFEEFSLRKNVNYIQLFGYNNWNKLPALIFYDAPVPIANILKRDKSNSLLLAYLEYQFDATKMSENGVMAYNEAWIEPHCGALRKGPFVKKSLPDGWPVHIVGFRSGITACDERPFLPLQAYHDPSIILEYLTQVLSPRDILRGIGRLGEVTSKSVNPQECVQVLSSLPGIVYIRDHQDAIARWPGDIDDRFYEMSRLQGSILNIAQAHNIMDDGSVRCGSKSSTDGNTLVYFFNRPVPRPADDEHVWNSWLRRPKYFWSLDEFGSKEISPSLQHSLGLPAFKIDICINHHWWDCDIYRTIELLYTLKGFDPATAAIAESFNLPALEIVGDKARFEEVQPEGRWNVSSSFRQGRPATVTVVSLPDQDTMDTEAPLNVPVRISIEA
ncbi:hypothetical protein VNI00_009592 [Paramarasmius palmivorus]|uniref:Uncharacterized protein n=1 Tax=Paramarasmius palmivorus TaxID=297713 RepID=A0AAW0CQ65_9AGAR